MEALGWLGGCLSGGAITDQAPGDVVASIRKEVSVPIEAPSERLMARGGALAGRFARVLVSAALRYGRAAIVTVTATDEGVRVAVSDPGTPVDPAHRDELFELMGQVRLKKKSEGRYARFLGLPAVAAAVRDLGGTIGAGVDDERCLIAFVLPPV